MEYGDPDEEPGWRDALREKFTYVLGVAGLLAWFVLLWLMLKDVM